MFQERRIRTEEEAWKVVKSVLAEEPKNGEFEISNPQPIHTVGSRSRALTEAGLAPLPGNPDPLRPATYEFPAYIYPGIIEFPFQMLKATHRGKHHSKAYSNEMSLNAIPLEDSQYK